MSKTASGLPKSALLKATPGDPETMWEERGRQIWVAVNRSAWDLGDWWNSGAPYGDRVERAERIGWEHKTCRNAGVVAAAFDVSRRRDTLSWGHHAEVAALDPEAADRWLDTAADEEWGVHALRAEVKAMRLKAPTPDLPADIFRTIVADPPWAYDEGWPEFADKAGDAHTRIDLPYQSMTLEEIADLDVAALSAPDAHLFLWTTNRYLRDAYEIVERWGFEPSQVLSWCKPPRGIGPGGVFSNTTEFVLYARRGNPPYNERVDSTWWTWPRGKHSEKPLEFLQIVEKVCGAGLEMFSRDPQPGWTAWGLEA